MQNVGIQVAKMAPAKQAANQNALVNSGANLGADNSVNTAPNAFAELLKKQVKQQKVDGGEANDSAKAADTTTTLQKTADDSVVAESTASTDPTQTSKPDTEQKTDEGLPAIQDLLLMQIGLQSAPQVTNTVGAVANSALSSDKEAELATTNPLPMLSTGTAADAKGKGAEVTDTALHGTTEGTDKATPELAVDDKAKPLNAEQGISKTLVRDKDFKEVEMKATAVQISNVAATSTLAQSKVPDNVATSMMAASEIPTPFGRPEWNQAVNQRVMWMVGGGDQSATLTLNPPDLGPLQVVIQVDNDQVDTTFISDNPEVRQALQDGMNMLRDKMQDSGMQLGNAQVSSQAQSQRHFEQAMQQRAQQRLEQTTQAANSAEPATVSNTVVQRVSNGLVDTFA